MRRRRPPPGMPAHPLRYEGDTPVLGAVPSASGRGWNVWCCWCRRIHSHAPESGHRAAHCIEPESPYRTTGYVLELLEGDVVGISGAPA